MSVAEAAGPSVDRAPTEMKWNGMELCRIEMEWQNLLELLLIESQL